MKFLPLSAIIFISFFASLAKGQNKGLHIIPQPTQMSEGKGLFKLTPKTIIYHNKPATLRAAFFATQLRRSTGYKLPLVQVAQPQQTGINIFMLPGSKTQSEAYQLMVNTASLKISAATSAGLFNGFQSVLQLLPPAILSAKAPSLPFWPIPAVNITDEPRFAWRGYMQDVSRTFYQIDVLKKYMDVMALYKLNTLHLHLTDDQGWRLEIKKYPELTSKKTTVFIGKQAQPDERSGFYTQAQIKELIAYAAERNITIVPEIDVPGHTWPIIITHPTLGVNKKTSPDFVFPFVDSWGYWGFQFTPNPLDPTKEEVYAFLTDVFNEVADLFPSTYIHFGGDEVVHRLWENEPHVQAFMKEKGFSNVTALQSYFVGRVCEIIKKKGKKPIGWNDILEGAGNLTKETAIMSWLGNSAVKRAASKGFYTVATPTAPLYFDITQEDRNDGTMSDLAYENINAIEKVYCYNPTEGLSNEQQAYVLGVQANMWPAIPQEVKDINVQNFPRLLALAEAAWTNEKNKNFVDFSKRLATHYAKLDTLKIDYFKKGGYVIGHWKPDQLAQEKKILTWEVTPKVYANGRVIAGFFYTHGDSFLNVSDVSLLEDGKIISTDAHASVANKFRGTHKTKEFLYYLNVDHYKPTAKYTLVASVVGEKSSDSYGNVSFNLSPYRPFESTEHSKK